MMRVSGSLETLDGAIVAEFPAQSDNVRRLGQTDDFGVAARADLRAVRGSLTLDPHVSKPRVGRLDRSLQIADAHHPGFGVLNVSVAPDWDNLPENAGVSWSRLLRSYRGPLG